MADLERLVVRAKAGDQAAFAGLVGEFQHMAVGYSYSLLHDWGLAEDASQEAFWQAYRSLGSLAEPAAFPGWFKRIVFHCCHRILRRDTPVPCGRDDAAEASHDDPGQENVALLAEDRTVIREALSALDREERTVVMLHYWGGYDYREIASFLAMTVNMVNNRLFKARRKLRESLLPAFQEEYISRKGSMERMKRKIIEGLAALPGRDSSGTAFTGDICSLVGALTVALQLMGEDISYEQAMGLSGAGYRIAFRGGEWDYSSVDGLIGFDYVTPLLQALGFSARFHYGRCDRCLYHRLASSDCTAEFGTRYETDEELRAAIVSSIDRGMPVVAIDLIHLPEWGVITGYDDHGRTLYCRTYLDASGGGGYATAERLPWFFITFEGRTEKSGPRENLLASLHTGLAAMRVPRYGAYANGLEAYQVWASELVDEEMEHLPPEILARRASVNSFCLSSLSDARLAAAQYLRASVSLLAGESAQRLEQAAQCDEDIVRLIEDLNHEGALIPVDAPECEASGWSRDARRQTAAALWRMLECEEKAGALCAAILKEEADADIAVHRPRD